MAAQQAEEQPAAVVPLTLEEIRRRREMAEQYRTDHPNRPDFRSKQRVGYEAVKNWRGVPLTPGTNKRDGTPYKRYAEYGPGGQELLTIVAGLNKGIRQINGTQTYNGAWDWINKYHADKNWEARKEDITGPNGKPDGMDEVVIYDSKGRVKVVNGYTLTGSDYPWKAAYYDTYRDEKSRRENPFIKFKRDYMETKAVPDENGNYIWEKDLPNEYKYIRKQPSAQMQLRKIIFQPTWKLFDHYIKALDYSAMDKAQLSSKIFKFVFMTLFERPAVLAKNPDYTDIDQIPAKKYNTLRKNKKVKELIANNINVMLGNAHKQIMHFILCAHLIAYALKEHVGVELNQNEEIYGVKISELLDFNKIQTFEDSITQTAIDHQEAQIAGIQSVKDAYNAEIAALVNKRKDNYNKLQRKQYNYYTSDFAQAPDVLYDAGWALRNRKPEKAAALMTQRNELIQRRNEENQMNEDERIAHEAEIRRLQRETRRQQAILEQNRARAAAMQHYAEELRQMERENGEEEAVNENAGNSNSDDAAAVEVANAHQIPLQV